MKKLFFIIFIILSSFSFSQNKRIDSLEIELKIKQSAKEKNEVYKILCKELNRIAHPDKSINIYLKALSNTKKIGDSKFEARINRYLFKANKHIGKNDLALKYINQALDIDKAINNIDGILLDVNLLGTYYIDTQNNKKAIGILNEGISYYNEKDSINTICVIHTNLGIAYLENGDWEKAVQYYIKAIEYSEKLKSYEDKNFALHQLGVAHMLQGNYKKAENYFIESLKDSIHNKYPSWRNANHHALAYNYWCMKDYKNSIKHGKISEEFNHKIGNAYQEFEDIRYQVQSYNYIGEYEKAIEAAKRGIQLKDKISFTDLIFALKVNISTSYLFSEKYDDAEKHLSDVLSYMNAKKEVKRINKQRLYKNLSILYEKKHQFEKSLMYYKKYQKENEEELTKQRDSKITEIETKYNNEKIEKELIQKEKDISIEKNKNQQYIIYILLLVLISLLSIIAYAYYHKKFVKNKKELSNIINKITKIEKELFTIKDINTKVKSATDFNKKEYYQFLMKKYDIEKFEIIEIWESIANGISRKQFAKQNKISENTIKTWRNELYSKLKSYTNTEGRYSDYKAVIEYYNSLRWYESHLSNE